MRRPTVLLAAIAIVGFLAAGAIGAVQFLRTARTINAETSAKIQPGMAEGEVAAIIGRPQDIFWELTNSQFNGEVYEYWVDGRNAIRVLFDKHGTVLDSRFLKEEDDTFLWIMAASRLSSRPPTFVDRVLALLAW